MRIKETKEVYEGEVTELTPCETENPMGGYGKTISHVIIGLKTAKGTKQLKVRVVGSPDFLKIVISASSVFNQFLIPIWVQQQCKETVLLDNVILLLSTYLYLFGVPSFWILVFSPTNRKLHRSLNSSCYFSA